MTITTPIKVITAISALVASSIFSASIVHNMAADRCYGPAFPVAPQCTMSINTY